MIAFDNSYARLPDRFHARLDPTPVARPGLIRVNQALARDLGIDPAALESPEGVAVLAGNRVPDGAEPLAMAYAGHQFGGWVPQLGDGRAILLGEVTATDGQRRDIQLKGAGRTPFSRMGDGRAWLGPVLREYLVSEAMAALGVPTTRALAAVTTGETVLRETPLPGAVLTRVAASHIRVGTFQYFAARNDIDGLRLLADMVIARHYPDLTATPGPYAALLDAIIGRQARLVAQWMGTGFIHGVMNTDNMAVSGETIDYGPCAFMDGFDPDKVFSSIDRGGRYAYSNQPHLAQWNLAQLASALLPLMNPDDREAAVPAAQALVDGFTDRFRAEWLAVFRAKIGLGDRVEPEDEALIARLLTAMAEAGADFTATFRALGEGTPLPAALAGWHADWTARLSREGATPESRAAAMNRVNPAIIPRNHLVEQVIASAVEGDFAPFHAMTVALERPFDAAPDSAYRTAPLPAQEVARTFCGT
ncbi:YdiU family protein [Halovulum dunhuangense]|uniref:Protein nucleotidyltransferase YdiU n=1 Tax=Halovulum dunhuangense TaxID=1505036 RepID=A0A849L0G5_9RHOB|nr:YdiU family protein [Halovulum dunhuangense]NNU79750.1 YdiU family protein [Halovulum dunhuangense]